MNQLDKNGNEIKQGQWVSPRQTHADFNSPQRIFYVDTYEGALVLVDGYRKTSLANYKNGDTKYHAVEIVEKREVKEEWSEHNLNDQIEFQLTNKGIEFVKKLNSTDPVYSRFNLQYTSANFPYKTSLWDFCNIFGPTFCMGFDQTVKTSFKLRKQ